jgi:hypothetical protein
LDEYGIEYALLNYVDELEELTILDEKGDATITYAPFTSTHFPRTKWALIYWDDDGMVLIKRNGVNAGLLSLEYTSVFPEGKQYHQMLARSGKLDRMRAVQELQRKLAEDPLCRRANYLLQSTEIFP